MNAIKKLLDAVEFSPGIYPYVFISDPTGAAAALQELRDFEPLLDDLTAVVREVQDTRNKLDELLRLLNEEKTINTLIA